MNRKFHLGDILSITTSKLLSPRHIEGVYDILSYMTGESLFTHQLNRCADECKPFLIQKYPWLSMIDASDITTENYKDKLAILVEKYGEIFEVEPIPSVAHIKKNPVEELATKIGKDKRITIKT